ncbi:MAG: hypothetical protein Q9214_007202, partial [Letrouitia sp. 1 TL-2023]
IGQVIEKQRAPGQIVPIEIFPGAWSNAQPSKKKGEMFSTDFSDDPRMGCSIGLRGDAGSGSLGGFFYLKFNNIRFKGFLTCAHVVRPTPRLGLGNVLKELDIYGLRPKLKNKTAAEKGRTDIVYSSQIDSVVTKKKLHISRENGANLVAKLEKDIREGGHVGKAMSLEKQELSIRQANLQASQALQRRLEKTPYLFEQTLVSSGKEVNRHWKISGYAFIRCRNPQKNEPPFFNPQNGHNLPTSDRVKDPLYYSSDSTELYIAGTNKLKLRRTSTVVSDHRAGTWKETDIGEYSEEFVIVNASRDGSDKAQHEFTAEGDSGSLVVDAAGRAAGLLFAKITNWCGPMDRQNEYVGKQIQIQNQKIKFHYDRKHQPMYMKAREWAVIRLQRSYEIPSTENLLAKYAQQYVGPFKILGKEKPDSYKR